jgi:Tfp pilus assembly protein PilO
MNRPRLPAWGRWQIHCGGLAVIVALTAAAYLLEVRPLLAERRVHAIHGTQLQKQRQALPAVRHTVDALTAELTAARQALAQPDLKLEPAAGLNQRLALLAEWAGEHGLQVDVVEPGKVNTGPEYDTISIGLRGKGSYRNCTRFLRALRQRLPTTAVVALDLAAAPDGSGADGAFGLRLAWPTAPAAATPAQLATAP